MGVRTSLSLGSEGGAVAKELALTALIGLTLTVPMVSLQTVDDVGGLQLHGRWGATVFIVVALVLGRLGIILLRTPGREIWVANIGAIAAIIGFLDQIGKESCRERVCQYV